MTAGNRKNQKGVNHDSPQYCVAKPDVSNEVLSKWQMIVDTMAKIIGVPASVIMKVDPPHIEVLVKSNTEGNPYKSGERYDLTPDLYCQWVMKHNSRLLVPNALKDPQWDHNPEIKSGMISYMGLPLRWPDGEMFGTVCVVDSKENRYSDTYQDMMSQFRDMAESHLALLAGRHGLHDRLFGSVARLAASEAQLNESEERFRTTFEQAAVGIAHVATDGQFLRINQKFCEIVGFTKEEMLTRTFQDITHPDDLDADLEYVRQVLAGEIKTYSMEKRYFKKDGEVVWINLTVSLLRRDNGQPRYFIAVVEGITERKEAEDMLKISQAIAHVGNWSIKRGEEIVVCSDEVCRIFGLPVGSTGTFEMFNEVIHPDDREYVKSSWMTALNNDQFDVTYRILVDGQLKWVEVKAESMFHKEDEAISVVGTVQDITKRKEAEDRFRLLVEQAGDAFFVLDYDGVISDVNHKACESLGYSREELLGMKISEVDADVDEKQHKHQFWDSLEPGNHVTFEGVHRRKDESTFPVEVRLGRLDLGEKRFLLALARDVSDRKRKEERLKKHVEFQELVSRISSRFTGLSGVEFEQAIHDALAQIGGYFNVDSVKFYRLSLQGEVVKLRITWRAKGLAPPNEMPELLKRNYAGFAAHYSQGESLLFDSSRECPPWPGMRETMDFLGVKAGLGVPLECDDSGVDIFAMDEVQTEYVWPEDILQRAEAIGRIILGAMRRREAEVELQDSFNEIRELKDRLEQETSTCKRR